VDERKPGKQKYNIAWFQRGLNRGLAAFLKATHTNLALTMSFQFEAIDDEFLKPDPTLDHGFSLIFQPVPVYSQ